jgi:hypothetical protein
MKDRFCKTLGVFLLGVMVFNVTAFAPLAQAQTQQAPIDGDWFGSLSVNTVHMRILIKLTTTASGLSAQLQSPDQSPQWLPATSAKLEGGNLSLAFTDIHATYVSKLSADRTTLEGTFMQNGMPLPLTLKHVTDSAQLERKRPQMPVPPFPYKAEDVSYTNKAAGNTIAATLTLPQGKGPFPAVLLICGSGPHDRDETLLGHKPFWVLADALTRRGIAVLRADKRGIGKSTGNYATATTADFAADAEAGIDYLLTRPEVDAHRIGLLGHSEGGIIAPMVAATDSRVDFIVMLAGSGVPGDQIILEQGRLIALAAGSDLKQVEDAQTVQKKLFGITETEKDPAMREKALRDVLTAIGTPTAQIDGKVKTLTSPWFLYFLSYDPATALSKVTIPVLALSGEKDLQVPPAQNADAIKKALEAAGNKHYEVDVLPGLNHLFQTAKTGSPSEYSEIEETMAPSVLTKIGDWILAQK